MVTPGDLSRSEPSGRPATDVALSCDLALERLLEWRRAHLQQGLTGRIKAVRRPARTDAAEDQVSDREQVHQLRTGLRRLRSMAEAFPQHWRGPKTKSLRRLARSAGTVRDLDVLLESLEEQRRTIAGAERKRLGRLIQRLERHRAEARRTLARRLKKPPKGLLGISPQPAAGEPPAGRSDAHRHAVPLLRAGLIRQLAALRLHPGWGHGERPRANSRQERQQHELRKAFKRFRYQLELLEALEPDLRDRLLILKQTQNSLGLLQDLVIWRGLLKHQLKGGLSRRLPELSARWDRQADEAWSDWCILRRQWLDPAEGLEAWQRWLLELEIAAG